MFTRYHTGCIFYEIYSEKRDAGNAEIIRIIFKEKEKSRTKTKLKKNSKKKQNNPGCTCISEKIFKNLYHS